MDFNEALKFKQQRGKDVIEEKGITFRVLVTPRNDEDFARYQDDYRGGRFIDNSAMKYCNDGEYCVRGLWTDNVNVLYKNI